MATDEETGLLLAEVGKLSQEVAGLRKTLGQVATLLSIVHGGFDREAFRRGEVATRDLGRVVDEIVHDRKRYVDRVKTVAARNGVKRIYDFEALAFNMAEGRLCGCDRAEGGVE